MKTKLEWLNNRIHALHLLTGCGPILTTYSLVATANRLFLKINIIYFVRFEIDILDCILDTIPFAPLNHPADGLDLS